MVFLIINGAGCRLALTIPGVRINNSGGSEIKDNGN
jgi:hypothetical protein